MARGMYLKDRVLTVACLSSVVAGEIKMREGELVDWFKDEDSLKRVYHYQSSSISESN